MADFTPDGSPVSGPSEMRGLYAGGGWGTEEVLAAPAAGRHLARTIAEDKISELTEPFSPDRFASGDLVYEAEGRGQRVA
jgi:sarcosine oxidase subunit beta